MQLDEIIQKRRSYRNIIPFNMDKKLIDELSKAASLAPSCANNQPWRYIFVYDMKKHEEINSALSRGNAWAHHGGMYIVAFSKKELDCDNESRAYYSFGTGMSFAFMMLKATELGLVVHPMAGYDEQKVREILNIPSEYSVITVAAVGKLAEEFQPFLNEKQIEQEKTRPQRLKPEEFAFHNSFKE
ncbi:MAG: nitroreductase family protein [Acidobacteria bacterium]|nr:nitroreductase family protein [Acidobacteriota bacterium]